MAGIAIASYRLEVSWGQRATGLFTIGRSVLGGADTFAASAFEATFDGPNDNLSALFSSAKIERGRTDIATRVMRGTARIEIRDHTGLLNPHNPDSPLHDDLAAGLHPIRLTGTFDSVTYGRFYGWVEVLRSEPSKRRGLGVLECVDLTHWLEEARPIIASTGPTTTGGAVGKILDAIEWTNPALRELDTGDAILDFSADGTKTGLQLIDELLLAERGLFFVTGAGVARYADRHFHARHMSAGTISNVMRSVAPGVDFREIRNRARVAWLDPALGEEDDPVVQEYVNEDSRRRYGYKDIDLIETPYLTSNGQALSLSRYLTKGRGSPRSPLYGLSLSNREPELLEHILARELVDMLEIEEAQADTAMGEFHIEHLDEAIVPPRHEVSWTMSRAPMLQPFIIGRSVIDGADVFTY